MNPVMGSNLPAALCEDWCTVLHPIPAILLSRSGAHQLNNLPLVEGFIRLHCEGLTKPANERLLFYNENHLIANKSSIALGATEAGEHEADPSVSEGSLLPRIYSREATNCSCLCLLVVVP
jgi:hypothetical protein